ncbi:MAG TPA: T9SS type A sorting domain-containing protein, partial [Cytophagaceae bacterium]
VLSNFLYNRPNLTFGIEWNGGSPEIVCNTISNGKGYGIQAFCDGSIANNIIHDLDKDSFAGIEVLRGSPRIGNNYIYKCVNGITIRANTDVTINPTITYNTIISNKYAGITFSTLYSSGVVKDNLISNNAIGILQLSSIDNGINTTPKEVSYNLIFDNGKDFEGVKIIGIGEQVSVNTNGDPVDSYFNVMSSAKFLNDTPPQASAISPSLGAGENKTNIGYNDEGKCSKIVTSAMSKSNSFTSEIYLYPNPVLDYATLNFKHSVQGNTKVVLYNVLGTEVYSKDFNSSDEIKMDLSALGHGTYSCEVSNEDHKKVLKLIK